MGWRHPPGHLLSPSTRASSGNDAAGLGEVSPIFGCLRRHPLPAGRPIWYGARVLSMERMVEALRGDLKVLEERVDNLNTRMTERLESLDAKVVAMCQSLSKPPKSNGIAWATVVSSSIAAVAAIIVALLEFLP